VGYLSRIAIGVVPSIATVFDDPNRIHLSIKDTYSLKTQASKTSGVTARFWNKGVM
jgi:hypothetical protein